MPVVTAVIAASGADAIASQAYRRADRYAAAPLAMREQVLFKRVFAPCDHSRSRWLQQATDCLKNGLIQPQSCIEAGMFTVAW
jgi:hypothetical protein